MPEPDEQRRSAEADEQPEAVETHQGPEPEERQDERKEHGWAPVVYGRTRRADRWWRAVPAGVDPQWLTRAVTAVTAGGRDLERRPRFLLAQNRSDRLIGVACRSAEISSTMNSDGSRPLYCFVGWCAPLDGAVGEGPALRDLREYYVDWAAPVYEKWMSADWEVHPSRLHQPHPSSPGPAPWRPGSHGAVPRPESHRPVPDEALYWPSDAGDRPWGIAVHSRLPCAVSLGWRRARDAQALTVPRSDIVADDVEELSRAPRPVARRAQYSRPPSGGNAPPPEGGSRGDGPRADDRAAPSADRSAAPGADQPARRSGKHALPPALRPTPERGVARIPPTDPKPACFAPPPQPAHPPRPTAEGVGQEHGNPPPEPAPEDRSVSWPPLLSPREWRRRVKRLGGSASGKHRNRPRPERGDR